MQFSVQSAAAILIGIVSIFVVPSNPGLAPIAFLIAVGAIFLERYRAQQETPEITADEEPAIEEIAEPMVVVAESNDEHSLALFSQLCDGQLAARHPDPVHPANLAIEQIQTAIEEIIALSELMAAGDLSTRANGTYSGDISRMGQRLNEVQDALIRMIEKAASVAADVTRQSHEMRSGAVDIEQRVARQTALMDEISASISSTQTRMHDVREKASASGAKTAEINATAKAGVTATQGALGALSQMEKDTQEVGSILSLIEALAQQTGLLAVNASIEAARAGEAGRGFAVVSDEVKELATRSQEASLKIRGIVQRTGVSVSGCSEHVTQCSNLMDNIAAEVSDAEDIARQIERDCQEQSENLDQSREGVAEMERHCSETAISAKQSATLAASLDTAAAGLQGVLDGFRLHDDTMVEAVQSMAQRIVDAFEAGIANGTIKEDALFDNSYTPVPCIEPPQFTTPFTSFTDAVLPEILESVFDLGSEIAFAAAINTDGFIPTHNLKFSHTPRPEDPVFNAGNARNRRFFKDRVGLAAGQSTADVLIQSYRRDMGGGNFVTMKDISAPIYVRGKHWGGLRIGYRPKSTGAEVAPARQEKAA